MRNSLRLGAAVAATALMGVTDNSEADPSGFGAAMHKSNVDENNRLTHELTVLGLSNIRLTDELDATRLQVEELLMRLDTMQQACEDATSEDGTERDVSGEHHVNIGGGGPFSFWQ